MTKLCNQTINACVKVVLSEMLSLARDGGRFQSTSRVYIDVLREFKPSRDLVWFAADVVRALLATGASAGSVIFRPFPSNAGNTASTETL